MPKDSMFYATLEEAIDAAREEFLANNPDSDEESANVEAAQHSKVCAAGWRYRLARPNFC